MTDVAELRLSSSEPSRRVSSTPKLETAGSFETMVTIYQTIRRDTPEDPNLATARISNFIWRVEYL
jgi:hypothetical protein